MAILEDKKPSNSYNSPLNITDEIRQFSDRRECRARELGIPLYILGNDPEKDEELQRLEDYIVENYSVDTLFSREKTRNDLLYWGIIGIVCLVSCVVIVVVWKKRMPDFE